MVQNNVDFTGVRAYHFGVFNLRYELKGNARTRLNLSRVVLGPCEQCCSREASAQKLGPKLKI